jgi:CAAX amino terminal protease family.
MLVVLQRNFSLPDILTNAPIVFPVAAGALSLYIVLKKYLDTDIRERYGLKINKAWAKDFAAGIILGGIFQGLITAAMIQTGSAQIISFLSFETGLSPVLWSVAFASTVVGFFGVAFWEELVFRGLLIKNVAEGITSRLKSKQKSIIISVVIGPFIFGIPHIFAVAEGASLSFAMFQASTAALYFGIAYVYTDRLALPIGIHLISNFWFASLFGGVENGFPAIARIQRDLTLGYDAIFEFLLPAIFLIGLIIFYAKASDKGSLKDFI